MDAPPVRYVRTSDGCDIACTVSGEGNKSPAVQISARGLHVLRLIAAGKSNQQFADELVISLNTVRRHVSNLFDKTGSSNRVQAAAYARDRGFA
jgi:DNA-binding NarL/FixJ family response regulator